MKKLLAGLATTLVLTGSGGAAIAANVDDPPPSHTIVDVSGDGANGFTIEHYDGTVDYPPTRSESRAECSEYDAKVHRAMCRTELRVWFRDLRRLKLALAYAHQK